MTVEVLGLVRFRLIKNIGEKKIFKISVSGGDRISWRRKERLPSRQENFLGEKNVYPKEIALFQFIKEKYNFGGEKGNSPVKESQVGQIVLFDLGQSV